MILHRQFFLLIHGHSLGDATVEIVSRINMTTEAGAAGSSVVDGCGSERYTNSYEVESVTAGGRATRNRIVNGC